MSARNVRATRQALSEMCGVCQLLCSGGSEKDWDGTYMYTRSGFLCPITLNIDISDSAGYLR